MKSIYNSFRPELIYIFRINDILHTGCLKIGKTTLPDDVDLNAAPNSHALNAAAKERIAQYTKTAGIQFELLYTEVSIARYQKEVFCINDKDVHEVLLRSGIKRAELGENTGTEWFECDLETAKKAIAAAKEKRSSLLANEISIDRSPILFRPEQKEAIERTIKKFGRSNRMLWNAKMRFGKTLCALEVAKRMQAKRTIIVTHRPVVDEGWFEDFGKIFYDSPNYQYGSKNKGGDFMQMENACRLGRLNYIYFTSMQDLRGSAMVGGKFDKNISIFKADWDYLIVDEAHEGTRTDLGENVLDALIKPTTKVLQLSGTPFNLFDDFNDDEIYTWDYVMEQKAKQEWDNTHFGDPNPYAGLPAMNIFTFDLGKLMGKYMDVDVAFNFSEFFRTKENGAFVHEKDVRSFLDLLVKTDKDSYFPYSNKEFRDNFRHTLWRVPGVKAAKALSAMLQQHPVFQTFGIVNVAGEGDEDAERGDALELVKKAIKDNEYTITLSCGKLTTGVSVPEWTAVLMLSGTFNTAASAYMQTIFRVQTPARKHQPIKTNCYVFDFAPERTLKVIAETAKVQAKAGKTTDNDRKTLGDFLNFCPIISCEGTQMKDHITADQLFEQLKKVYVERVVSSGFEDKALYNDELLKLDNAALAELDELKKIIGTTKAMAKTADIDINNQGLTQEQYEEMEDLEKTKRSRGELTEEEKERLEELKKAKANRNNAISILRGISIRMPLLIYGAELTGNIKEVTLDNFADIVDDLSWEEFMPQGVNKVVFHSIRKYYDPDIFLAAGKRIRALVESADRMSVEQRISQIAAIFANFRNPDKETVLTPWRVVNMHMADTLGGYCFYDKDYRELIEEPRLVLHNGVTEKVFNSQARILEINSKSGLYPLYVAYSIYRAKISEALFATDTIEEQQRIWDDVVRNNVFVVCKTPMAKSITRRTLLGFRKGKANLHAFDDLINQVQNNKESLISNLSRPGFWNIKHTKNMIRFNAVVGNPPYQLTVAQKDTENGQKAVTSIFHLFQILADNLGQHSSLIYPGARWIHRSGKGLEQFGLQQINDPHLLRLYFYPNANDIFDKVSLADGISIVEKDKSKNSNLFEYIYVENGERFSISMKSPGSNLMPLDPHNIPILDKIRIITADKKWKYLSDSILPRSLFSIESDFVEKNPDLVRIYKEGDIFDKQTEIKLYTNNKAGKAGKAQWYIANRDIITTGIEELGKWKVIVSSANAGGQKRSNQLQVIDNYSAFGRSRVALKTFETEDEANNFYQYVDSELIRFTFLLTDEALTSLAKQVPDIGNYRSDNGIIDFTGDIDNQLYDLFNISKEEQEHIKITLQKKGHK